MAATCCSSEDDLSPNNRFKFLCSYGGKILPRSFDGQLKYVGGDTRVVAVPRSISFAELKMKMDAMFNGDAVIKYQLASEDLDALVSVTCDEDLRHLLDENDRQSSHSPRLRVFLFPSSASPSAAASLEQRYLDAVNGIPIAPSTPRRWPIFMLSSLSTRTSPTSTIDLSACGPSGSGGGLQRVRSTPNFGSLRSQASGHHRHHHHHHFQQLPPPQLQKQSSPTCSTLQQGGGGQCRSGGSRHPVVGYQHPGPQPLGAYYHRQLPAVAGGRLDGYGHVDEVLGRRGSPRVFCNSAPFKDPDL